MRTLVVFLLVFAVIGGGAYWLFVADDAAQHSIAPDVADQPPDDAMNTAERHDDSTPADLTVEGFELTHGQDGRAEWTLVAERGIYRQAGGVVDVENPTVTYYLENGESVIASAPRGEVTQEKNSASLHPDVTIMYKGTRVSADRLDYSGKGRVLDLSGGVSLQGGGWSSLAESMRIDLERDTVEAVGGVTANISSPSGISAAGQ